MGRLDDVATSLMKSARSAPFLEREAERELAIRWKDQRDTAALHALAHAHMRLVIAMASRFRHYGLPLGDLVQEGHIGLLEAAVRYEPERDIRFSTYATWWIRASIQDYILRNWSIVRGGTSSAQKALFFNLRRLRARLSRMNPGENSGEIFSQIATALGVSMRDVENMNARLSAPDPSLNAPVASNDEQGAEAGDFFADDKPLPDEIVTQTIDGERRLKWLRDAYACLNPRELQIIRARRLGEEAETLETLGERLGISKERVRQIENRALEKLRASMLAQRDRDSFMIS
ncbi:MAG: RNA polymerase factor sigma-32 [Alphaproteobacteria bacterium]|nr:RNA polymerase factor sigma-32 [Alphaproteobacteria bacterium]